MSFVGDGFEIESRWKETVIYREGADEYVFDAAWGVQRLRDHSSHIVEDDTPRRFV